MFGVESLWFQHGGYISRIVLGKGYQLDILEIKPWKTRNLYIDKLVYNEYKTPPGTLQNREL